MENMEKHIKFNLKPMIHIMYTWEYAYQAARHGQWEEAARDRVRFRMRIEKMSVILDPLLINKYNQYVQLNHE